MEEYGGSAALKALGPLAEKSYAYHPRLKRGPDAVPESDMPLLIRSLLDANRSYVGGDPAIPENVAPSARLAIVTCMDVRIDPLAVLGLRLGQAHVLRNAGARVTEDVLRSLVISQQALGTNAVILMPHEGCGVLGLDVRTLRPRAAASPTSVPALDFHAMQDLEAALAEDLRSLRESPWIGTDVQIHGLVLDVARGAVRYPGL